MTGIIMPKALTRPIKFKQILAYDHQQFACLDEEGQLWFGALSLTDLNGDPVTWLKANMPQAGQQAEQMDVEVE